MSSYEYGQFNYDIDALYKWPEVSFSQTSMHLDISYGVIFQFIALIIIFIVTYYIRKYLSEFHD